MIKSTIAVLFGGQSSEHDISIRSAAAVAGALEASGIYNLTLVYISRDGKQWCLVESTSHSQGPQVKPILGQATFEVEGRRLQIDCVVPILHGQQGEDGSIQGLMNLLQAPYVGCDIYASALCLHKQLLKHVLSNLDIPVVPWLTVGRSQPLPTQRQLIDRLGVGPWFVKPSRSGSSVGVSRVDSYPQLTAAVELAQQYDDIVLIERGVVGREFEVAVLGVQPDIRLSDVGEVIAGADFYSYDDKYADTSTSRTELRADLTDQLRTKILTITKQAYQAAGCSGLARVDFLYDESSGQLYINEINTMPGFTSISMYPKLWAAQGVSMSALLEQLISQAIVRHSQKPVTMKL